MASQLKKRKVFLNWLALSWILTIFAIGMRKSEQERKPILSDIDLIECLGKESLAAFDEKKCVNKIIRAAVRTIYWQFGDYCSVKNDDYFISFVDKSCVIDYHHDNYRRLLRFNFHDGWWHIYGYEADYSCDNDLDIPLGQKCNEQLCLLECMTSGKLIYNSHNSWISE